MFLAIPYENGQIFQHFGRTPQWKRYTIRNGTITASEILSSEGFGHSALITLLQNWQIDAVICGGIGHGAREKLMQAGITLYAGVSGNADDAVQQFLQGTLSHSETETCHHHTTTDTCYHHHLDTEDHHSPCNCTGGHNSVSHPQTSHTSQNV